MRIKKSLTRKEKKKQFFKIAHITKKKKKTIFFMVSENNKKKMMHICQSVNEETNGNE